MQDILTLAATVTAASLIGFILIGYPIYVWHRTAPSSKFLTREELLEEGNAELIVSDAIAEAGVATLTTLFAQADAIMSHPLYAADAPATPVKRRRKVSPPAQEVITAQPKKRGRPPKAKAA